MNINLEFRIKDIWNTSTDITSQINRIEVIIKDSNLEIGTMLLITSPANLLALNYNIEVFDIWDNSDYSSANAFYKLLDDDNNLNIKSFPNDFQYLIDNIDYMPLIIIDSFRINKGFRGKNVSYIVFEILKQYFVNHLFLLKAFPLNNSENKENNEFDSICSDISIKKLISLYSKSGFKLLCNDDYYMILIADKDDL